MNEDEVKKIVSKMLLDIGQKKIADTPSDNFDVVNKNYVDNKTICGFSNGGSTSIASATPTVLSLTNTIANGISWDSTNHQFVIITSGYYLISGVTNVASANSGTILLQAEIYHNGSAISGGISSSQSAFSSSLSTEISWIIKLPVGDTISLAGNQVSVSNQTVSGILTIQKID